MDLELKAFKSLLRRKGRDLRWLSQTEDTRFRALVVSAPPVDPALELSADPRELAIIEGLKTDVPDLQLTDFIEDPATGDKWQVLKRDRNPADTFAVRYWIQNVIAELDTTNVASE